MERMIYTHLLRKGYLKTFHSISLFYQRQEEEEDTENKFNLLFNIKEYEDMKFIKNELLNSSKYFINNEIFFSSNDKSISFKPSRSFFSTLFIF